MAEAPEEVPISAPVDAPAIESAAQLTWQPQTGNAGAGTLSELITERQVSKRWNFSLNTLRFWRSIGEGPPYVKIGRSVRYNVSALEKYLRRNTCESKTRATAEEALQHVAH